MQPPILTRQEATLWLKVSAHSTLVMNFNSQIRTFRFADFQTASRAAIIKLKKQHAHLQTTLTAHRNKCLTLHISTIQCKTSKVSRFSRFRNTEFNLTPFGVLRVNVQTRLMAQWKARGRLSISDN